jgi:hypothetical protein
VYNIWSKISFSKHNQLIISEQRTPYGPFDVCLLCCSYEVGNPHNLGYCCATMGTVDPVLAHTVVEQWEPSWKTLCKNIRPHQCNNYLNILLHSNGSQGPCWNTVEQQWPWITTMQQLPKENDGTQCYWTVTLDDISATMIYMMWHGYTFRMSVHSKDIV